jgi:hypothetical protein
MPDDIKSISSYEQDFSAWSLAQAEALRAARDVILSAGRRRADLPSVLQRLDWDNLAEEIEGLAKKDRREISSRITTIIEHLAKLEFSSAAPPRADWINTVQREREEVEDILRDSPSLRREAESAVARRASAAISRACRAISRQGEVEGRIAGRLSCKYTVEQVLGDWLPETPPTPAHRGNRRRRSGMS